MADALRILDFPIAEQVIEVPMISCSPCPSRCPIPEPQSADQLVEVPTVLSPTRIALQIADQIVDTPAPRGRVHCFLPQQSSTATTSLVRISERIVEQTDFPSREERISERIVEQIVEIPGHGRGVFSRGGFHGSVPAVPGQRSTAFGGGHQDFLPEQVSTAFSGAEHVYGSPVPGERPDYGRLHGSVAGQSSTACRGAHLHQLLPEDVVNEELQERLAAHVLSLERTRSVVLFSQRSKLYDEAGRGRGSGSAGLWRRRAHPAQLWRGALPLEDVLCQCEVEHSSRRGVRWRTFEFTDDDPKAAHLLVVFASEELALQFKDAFEAAQASLAL